MHQRNSTLRAFPVTPRFNPAITLPISASISLTRSWYPSYCRSCSSRRILRSRLTAASA